MQNIFNFVWKYQFTLIVILLELVAFLLLAQSNKYHNANFYSRTNAISSGFYASINNASEYLKLQEINDNLAAENTKLQGSALSAFVKLRSPHIYVEDTLFSQQYKYLTAKVINNTTHKRNNYIVINQGSEQGIQPEMGVITNNGIVGIVKDVSPHFSTVISLLHKSTQISAKLEKNNYFGLLTWKGGDPTIAYLSDIPSHVELSVGDIIVSRGSSTIFPEGIPIGKISSFKKQKDDNFYDINVTLSTNFSNIHYVHIVKNLLKKEQLELQQITISEDGE